MSAEIGGTPSGSATRYELISIPEPVSAMDTDLSGTVTREELHRAAARRFGILDQKQRGYLTIDDLPEPDASRHKEAAKHGGHGGHGGRGGGMRGGGTGGGMGGGE